MPSLVYTSWKHAPGEQRLHLERAEPVHHRTLAAHYHARFYDFWRQPPPKLSKRVWDKQEREYADRDQAKDYPVNPNPNGIPANEAERRALGEWSDPAKRRRKFQTIAGNLEI